MPGTSRGTRLAVAIAGALSATALAAAGLAGAPGGTPLEVALPPGLDDLPVPDDNPMTVEKIELGKILYFDKRLSADGTVSCATCHDPAKGWADNAPVSTGIRGQKGGRSAPTVLDTAYGLFQFWDGRAASLEEQALGPIENPIEMGEALGNVERKLDAIPGCRERFRSVFGTGVTRDGIAKAIAAFERTAHSGGSAWDRYEGATPPRCRPPRSAAWVCSGRRRTAAPATPAST